MNSYDLISMFGYDLLMVICLGVEGWTFLLFFFSLKIVCFRMIQIERINTKPLLMRYICSITSINYSKVLNLSSQFGAFLSEN